MRSPSAAIVADAKPPGKQGRRTFERPRAEQNVVNRAVRRKAAATSKRDGLGEAYKVVVAPSRLDIIGSPAQTLNFIASIRRAALVDGRRVFIDLEPCVLISPSGCLILTAEIERCQSLRPGCISGRDPTDLHALGVLELFGFHNHLGMKADQPPRIPFIARIRAGTGRIDDLPQTMGEVADLAHEAWKDQALADRVHGALNEAMTNVLMHAYAEDALDLSQCVPGRWWIAGLMDPKLRHAWFFALDQGAGIPRTAPKTYFNLYSKYGIDPEKPSDGAILAAAIQEGGSRTGLSQHGRGLPAMIDLIRQRASGGYVNITSRRGSFFYRKERGARGNASETLRAVEATSDMAGTLIVWKVEGPV